MAKELQRRSHGVREGIAGFGEAGALQSEHGLPAEDVAAVVVDRSLQSALEKFPLRFVGKGICVETTDRTYCRYWALPDG